VSPELAEPIDVDRTHLLDKDPGGGSVDLDLRAERC
jgi:hypothetical protein